MDTSTMTKRQIQAIETKQKILDTTTELLKSQSYENIKITDICKKAEISIGNFYHHFESKRAVLDEGYLTLSKMFLEKTKDLKLPPLDKINHAFKIYADICENKGYSFVSVFMRYELFKNTLHENASEGVFYSFLLDTLKEAFDKKILQDGDAEIVSSQLFRVLKGTIFDWIIRYGEFCLYDEILKMSDLVLGHYKSNQDELI